MEVIRHKAKNKILRIGRQAGKTELIVRLATTYALILPYQNIGIISKNYNHCKNILFSRFEHYKHSSWVCRSGDSLQIQFPNGSVIYILSGNEPESLRGYTFHHCFLDEYVTLPPDLLSRFISPTLSTTNGSLFISSTPLGRNHFYSLWESVKDNPDWGLFHYSSAVSELISPEFIEEKRQLLTEDEFREEYLAEFVGKDGSVFRNILECATIKQSESIENHKGHTFVMGVDWGQSNDFSVFTVMCQQCGMVVDWLRFNKIDYIYQRDRLKELQTKWNCYYILAEANSIGTPNIEMLYQEGLPVTAFNMTAQSKPKLIRQLVLSLEQGKIKIPTEYIGELQAYESKQSANGHISYSAPNGMHDDRVISLALAEQARKVGTGFGMVII